MIDVLSQWHWHLEEPDGMTIYDCIFGPGCKMAECMKYHPKEGGVEPLIGCKTGRKKCHPEKRVDTQGKKGCGKAHLEGLEQESKRFGKTEIDKIIENKFARWGPWDLEWLGAPNRRKASSNKICPIKISEYKGDQHITIANLGKIS